MTGVRSRLALGLVLLLSSACAASGPVEDIAPGEEPSLESEEAGLWMAMDRIERDLQTSGLLVRDPELNAYVRGLVCDLAGPYCEDVRVYILRVPAFNASMAPNGSMQVWTGLLLRAENEAQLAYVLGHELGHFIRRHTLTRWRDARAKADAATFLGFAGALAGVPVAGLITSSIALASIAAFSRDQEREADTTGFEFIRKAGYDAAQASVIWENLIAEREAAEKDEPFFFFASHPPTTERRETLAQMAEQAQEQKGATYEERYMAATLPFRLPWLRDELAQRNFGSLEVVLDRLIAAGHGLGELHYIRGEMYRLRDEEGDEAKAVEAYEKALAHADAPPETYRSLGLAEWRLGHTGRARSAFERYLELAPDADDRLMIEAHIEELS